LQLAKLGKSLLGCLDQGQLTQQQQSPPKLWATQWKPGQKQTSSLPWHSPAIPRSLLLADFEPEPGPGTLGMEQTIACHQAQALLLSPSAASKSETHFAWRA